MANKTVEIRWENPNKLLPAPWNPAARTKDRKLTDLVASMRQDGFWGWEPIQLARTETDGEWVIADGNRRQRAAIIAGITEVPVVRLSIGAQEYWARKNGTIKPPSVRETGEAIARGLTYIPPAHSRSLNALLSVFDGDWEMLREICSQGASPGIVNMASRIANYTGFKDDNEFMVRTIRWLIEHHMSMVTSRAILDGIEPDVLLDKITTNQPIRSGYS